MSMVWVTELARQYDCSTSTISTILKQRDAIKSATPAKGTTILSQLGTNTLEKMEKFLLVWVKDEELAWDTGLEAIRCDRTLNKTFFLLFYIQYCKYLFLYL